MMSPRIKFVLVLIAGLVSGVALSCGGLVAAYFFAMKPMTENALKAMATNPPPFPRGRRPAAFDLRCVRADGSTLDLAALRGKVIVLNVWATWCPPCMAELPSLGGLAAHFAGETDVAVVCVSTEPASSIWPKMSRQAGMPPLYRTERTGMPVVFRTATIPATFVISRGGEIAFEHLGMANWENDETFAYVDKLRAEATPESTRSDLNPKEGGR